MTPTSITTQDIITRFVTDRSDYYKVMKDTEHGYKGCNTNPYHLEGSIWTHTCMVLQEAEKAEASVVQKIAALCHDLGKPLVYFDNDKNRRSFNNHEGAGVFIAKKVLKLFPELTREEKLRVLDIVALHGSFYHLITSDGIPFENYEAFVKRYTYTQLTDLFEFYWYDHNGRFSASEYNNDSEGLYQDMQNIIEYKRSEYKETTSTPPKFKPLLKVLVGPPRAGKSTYINEYKTYKNDACVVISRDALVEKYGSGETYNECWNSLTPELHKEIDKELQVIFNKALQLKKDICIDMTNMSKKSRKKWLHNSKAKDYFKEAIVFIEDIDTLIERNDNKVSEIVFTQMIKNFVMPLSDEFDKVRIASEV